MGMGGHGYGMFISMVVMGGLVEWDWWVFFSSLCLFSMLYVTYLLSICKKVSMSLRMLWVVIYRYVRYLIMRVRVAFDACSDDDW
jgi:hypothetical protein